jgi:predicted MFS family arabinose efflux permease
MFHRTQPDSDATPTLPLGLLAAAGFLSAAGARVVDPLLSLMAHDFSTTVPAVSVIIAAFTLPYGLNQLLLGPLGDRYGKLRVMLGALIGYTVFTTLCATASGLPSLTLLRACAGASSAGLIPVCLAYIGDAVPYEMRKITLSRFATGVVLAQIMAGPLGGAIGEFVGWRGVFLLLGSVGVVVAATLAVRMRALPDRRNGRAVSGAAYRALLARSDARMLLLVTTA